MNTATKIDLSGPGAVYHRVSTDHQDTERQQAATREWLERHNANVRPEHVYEDVGWSRADARRRPAFQQALAAAEDGRIKWIVVDRQDRFGTKDKFELFHYLYRLNEAGCRLYTVDDKELTSLDTADSLMTHLSADQSERELCEKSVRNLEGKRQLALRGRWLGGTIPYALDVVAFRLINGDLIEQWRVQAMRRDLKIKISPDGTRRSYEGENNFPASEQDEILQLRPTTDAEQIDTLRAIFDKYANEDTSPSTIARQLNAQHVPPPAYSTKWRPSHVQYLLQNPAYTGRPAWNRHTSGDYFQFTGGRRVEKRPGEKPRKHAPEDWVMPDEPLYPAIIDADLFAKVQDKLGSRTKRPRAARATGYLLSGLVVCGNCGATMIGAKMPTKGKAGAYEKAVRRMMPAIRRIYERVRPSPQFHIGHHAEGAAAQLLAPTAKFQSALDNDDLERAYRSLFSIERDQAQAALDQLETEHSRLSIAWADLPTQRAKDKAAARLRDLEQEIDDLQEKVTNWADELRAAVDEYHTIAAAWDHARTMIEEQTTARAVAAAIKAVIGKVTVTFRPTGRNWPVGEVQAISIEPTHGFSGCASTMPSP